MATNNKVTRNDSILKTIAKLIGGEEDGEHFSTDLIVAINTALAILTQLGVGPEEGFSIENKSAKWSDFLGDDKRLNTVVSYICLKVQLLFDPPQSGVVRELKESLIQEMEWRSFIVADSTTAAGETADP